MHVRIRIVCEGCVSCQTREGVNQRVPEQTWLQSLAFILFEKDKELGRFSIQPSLICQTSGLTGKQTVRTRRNQTEEWAEREHSFCAALFWQVNTALLMQNKAPSEVQTPQIFWCFHEILHFQLFVLITFTFFLLFLVIQSIFRSEDSLVYVKTGKENTTGTWYQLKNQGNK